MQYVQGNFNELPDKGICTHQLQECVNDFPHLSHLRRRGVFGHMTHMEELMRVVLFICWCLFICEPDRLDSGIENPSCEGVA